MKRILIVCTCIVWYYGAFAQDKKVAVFDPAGDVSTNTKAIIREEISSVIVNTPGYAVLERALINKVLEENKFQMSGEVDDSQIGEIGKKMGANYVFVASINPFDNNFYFSFKMIDVHTARIEKQKTGKTTRGMNNIDEIVQKIVKEMFADMIALSENNRINTPPVEQAATQKNDIQQSNNMNFLIADGGNIFSKGQKLNQSGVRNLLAGSDALRIYDKGISMRKTGKRLIWTGIILAIAGGAFEYYTLDYGDNAYEGLGSIVAGLGVLSIGSGITYKIIGNYNIKKAVSAYNEGQYSQNHGMELHFGIVGNGVGLALKF
jgi:hypothetical protein